MVRVDRGWAIFTTGVLVIGSLADVSAFYIYRLFDLETLKNSREAVVILAIVIIVIMTAICVIGTELSARVQRVMVFAQVGALVLLVVVGAIQLIFGGAPETSITVSLSWLNPFEAPSYSALLSALLLGVFIYWGGRARSTSPRRPRTARTRREGGVFSVLILLAVYVGVAVVMLGIAGVDKLQNFDDNSNILGNVADDVLGPLSFLVALAIITSGIASTQTTILPASRTSLSMATQGAFPRIFARIHPRFLTPDFLDDRDRGRGNGVVRRRGDRLRQLPLRLALGAVADDRLLLRPDRDRA